VLIEPFTGANPGVLGFDPLADPSRRTALERARDTGAAALSPRVVLVQEGGEPLPGAVLYVPIYRAGTSAATLEERREALVGWAYLAFRIADFMEGLLGERGGDLAIEIYDGPKPSAATVLYDPDGQSHLAGPPDARHDVVEKITLAGHVWTVEVRSKGILEQRLGIDRPRIVAASGIVVSLLLAVVVLLLATSRARVLVALERSESLYRILARNFPNGVVGLFDKDLRFRVVDGTSASPSADPRSWVGKTVKEVMPPDLAPRVEEAFRSALAGRPARMELESRGRIVDSIVQPVEEASGRVSLGMVMTQDVTGRRRAERAVRVAAAYARSLIEASLDPLVTISPAGKITDVNVATESVTGVSRDQLVGTDFADYFTEPEKARAGYEKVLAEGSVRGYPLTIRHASGKTTDVVYNATVYRGPGGEPGGVLASARDVSEVRALQAQLAVASRLAAMGTLVAGVAHEVNNPLAAALADVEMALRAVREIRDKMAEEGPIDRARKVGRLDEVIEELSDAHDGARRIAQIVRELKAFASPGQERELVQLADVVNQATRQLPAHVHAAASVRVEHGGAPQVLASFGQLEQVVVALVTNAAKATRPGVPNTILVRTLPGPGGTARLEVADQGTGIEPDKLDRIFDPFFTTAEVGKGMGLGLAVCHSIVTSHGGTITVETEVGKGSTFRVDLPAAPAAS
jgi:PAS domain S-box-containing protein